MKTNSTIDTAKLGILLNELRLPAIKLIWPKFAYSSDGDQVFQMMVITDSR